ncbi:MAG: AMP-binding protein [SAR324 cluster bacterium]|nr:AMP-binding protein [SAR324 cluster bacterium]
MTVLPRVHETVVHMLFDAAIQNPGGTALVFEKRRLLYDEYLRCVGGFAHELTGLGVRGGRVALICGNSIEMAIAMFAIHAAGAQAVPINPIYTARELTHILSDADPAVVIVDESKSDIVDPLVSELGIPSKIVIGGEKGRLLDSWKDDKGVELPKPMPRPGDLATLQYTGGTTGLPKGVNIKHSQMIVNISQREAFLPTRPDIESVLCIMPLFHVFAVKMCLHLTAYCHGKLVILPRYHPDLVFSALAEEEITRLPAGPTIFIGLMGTERFDSIDFSHLKSAYSGSASLPEDILKRWHQKTGCPILEGYGQTEAGPVLTYMPENTTIRPGSVGPALPETEIQIVDTETGNTILGVGEKGEIRARGPQIMSGYRNRPQETTEALREGWLYTGDIGEFDEDGYLYIRDRKKDMIITGGYNVYPREVDEVLFAHPNVLEAATIGVPDSYRGEVIKSFIVLKPGAKIDTETILEYCASNLAKYKIPASIEFVKELPKTAVGKLDKIKLKES